MPCFTFLTLKHSGFELWSAWYNNYASKSLFSLISVIRHFKELSALNFVISMSGSTYKWNPLHPGFSSSVSIISIEIACQTAFKGVISCGLILWAVIKYNTSTPKIWKNVADVLQSYILSPDVFLPQN